MWVNKWIGLGYEENGRGPKYDCLGLFIALQKSRFNRFIEDPHTVVVEQARTVLSPQFCEVQTAREGDALLFRAGQILHCGFALNETDMLHIEKDSTGSVVVDWTGTNWASRKIGVFRFD